MVEYRFYRVSSGGLIDSGERVRLADDAAALAYARDLGESQLVEVWSPDRRIANIPPRRLAQHA